MKMQPHLRSFQSSDQKAVIDLWKACDLTRPWNDPGKDIARAIAAPSSDIWVGEMDGRIIASVMLGYDGHRGNIYYFSVHPDYQRCGIGAHIMEKIENHFEQMGCPKINLMVRSTNLKVASFYKSIGYTQEETHVHGKRLIADD